MSWASLWLMRLLDVTDSEWNAPQKDQDFLSSSSKRTGTRPVCVTRVNDACLAPSFSLVLHTLASQVPKKLTLVFWQKNEGKIRNSCNNVGEYLKVNPEKQRLQKNWASKHYTQNFSVFNKTRGAPAPPSSSTTDGQKKLINEKAENSSEQKSTLDTL